MRASRQDGRHPRPQLVREQWTSLDGAWAFAYDDDGRGIEHGWASGAVEFGRRITVPFAPESAASGIGDTGFHPVVWYRRDLELQVPSGSRAILHFGAVDRHASVGVDGALVAHHVGGQAAFHADITNTLRGSGPHVLVVRAEDDPLDAEVPLGKQDWAPEPHFIWYRRSTGIHRSVWLEVVPEQHVVTLDWSTDVAAGTVTATVTLARTPAPGTRLELAISVAGSPVVDVAITATRRRTVFGAQLPPLRNAMARIGYLWSPENPVLFDADLTLTGDGEPDVVHSYFGVRSTTVGQGAFLLNGLPYPMRGVLEQGYWPTSHFTAPDHGAYRREVELIRALGFNTARIHQKSEDPRMLYWADRLGLMIWAETASAYEFSPRAVAELSREWAELLAQYRNHPSIVTWVPANESWGAQDLAVVPAQREYLQALASLTRAIDPSRPVILNDGWEHVDSDIIGLHDYSPDPSRLEGLIASTEAVERTVTGLGPLGRRSVVGGQQRMDAPVMVSEFGGVAYAAAGTWGYLQAGTPEAFREQVAATFAAVHASAAIAGFCYTQLTDTEQEANGLATADRVPKLPAEELRAIVMGPRRPKAWLLAMAVDDPIPADS